MERYKGRTEEERIQTVLNKLEKFRKENYYAILDSAEDVNRIISNINIYDMFKPLNSIVNDISEEEKAKVLQMLQDPEIQKEIVQRLSLKFTPDVIEEIRKIEQRHAEEWPNYADIVYTNNQEKIRNFGKLMENPEFYKIITSMELKFDDRAVEEIEKTRKAHAKINPMDMLKTYGTEMSGESKRILRGLSKAGYDYLKIK